MIKPVRNRIVDHVQSRKFAEHALAVPDLPEEFLVLVECRDEQHQVELLKRLGTEGLVCRVLIS